MCPLAFDQSTHRHKRVRFSGDDSSEPSISDASTLRTTSVAEDSTDASDYGSDSESELSESSEEPSSESSSEDEDEDTKSDVDMDETKGSDGVINLRANRGKKPVMKLNKEDLGPDIRTFLKDFLPQLKAANDGLEAQREAGTLQSRLIEAGEDAEQYIEMDLGLGVLEAKDADADDSSASESDGSDTGDGEEEKDVLGKLMGRERAKKGVSIQEVA